MHVVITGSNRGLGLALARIYSARGHQVTALCRTKSAELTALPVRIVEGVDLREETASIAIDKALGNTPIDLLIQNAGVNVRMDLNNLDFEAIRLQFEVNAVGPLKVTSALLPNLKSGSKMIMIGSQAASIGTMKEGGRYGYRMSKAALNILTAILALDLKEKGITVAVLDPGYVLTEMIQGQAHLTPLEAAEILYKRIADLTIEDSGQFFDDRGLPLPW